MSPPRRTWEEAFEKHVDRSGDCWQWTGTKYINGYGKISSGPQQEYAHRWSYEHYVGPIPDGYVIDHLCRNRSCVNPQHMEPVTDEENKQRGLGYALRNGMRTTCINGHEYTPENTYTPPNGKAIRCRECSRIRDRKRSPRKRSKK